MDRANVNDPQFWKQRIETARQEHFSVYVTTPESWEIIAQIHKKIIQDLVGNDKVLDAGCGYGRASEWLKNYIGVDFSPDFIELAKQKYPDKTFIQGNLQSLPFKDKEFGWAFCISMKNMIRGNQSPEDWDLMEKELKRVAKKVLILEYTEPERYWII